MERENGRPKDFNAESFGFQRTLEFVDAAVDDEAYKAALKRCKPHQRNRLKKVIKTGLVYFKSKDCQADVARRLGMTASDGTVKHRRISAYLYDFIEVLWTNCHPLTRDYFGTPDFVIAKPRTEQTRRRLREAGGNVSTRVIPLALKGMEPKEICQETGLGDDQVRQAIRRARRGKVLPPSRLAINAMVEKTLKDPLASTRDQQEALDAVSAAFLYKRHQFFDSVPEFMKLTGIQNGHLSLEEHVEVLRDFGIPTILRKTSGRNRTAVLKSMTNRFLQVMVPESKVSGHRDVRI